ncbi:ArnT family glycosyltransferase [Thioalkalivibrio sulfidiphilus]|uniref:ArnT family glycosyltransferase n=1 Tax=Thioalkalivibrio sulfidiphilus TaxID=1033854 RepID=UPI00035F7BDB|nr:glycosyltransferase family 39 protein [Thioalkalivibrio sulfidiphilus]
MTSTILNARTLLLGLAAYFTIHALYRPFFSDSFEMDEAEIVLFTQWWLSGYTDQPPMFVWYVKLWAEFLGMHPLTMLLARNSLLFLTYLFVYFAARDLLRDERRAVLATLSLFLIPEILWEAQRDLTHSLAVLVMAAAFLALTANALRWVEESPSRRATHLHYVLAGGVIAGGLLSKYNFAFFLTAITLALLTIPSGRRLVLDWRTVAALILAFALMIPHLLWLAENLSAGTAFLRVHDRGDSFRVLDALPHLYLNTTLAFLSPLWLVLLVFFHRGWPHLLRPAGDHARLLVRYMLIALVILTVIVVALNLGKPKVRWVLPLFFLAPLVFFAVVPDSVLTARRVRWYARTCIALAAITVTFTLVRIPLAEHIKRPANANWPYAELAAQIRQQTGFEQGLILGHNYFISGNLHYQFRQPAYSSAAAVPPQSDDAARRPLIILWDAGRRGTAEPTERVTEWAIRHLGVDPNEYEPVYVEHPFKFSPTRHVARLGMVVVE